jgi:ATP-dependent Clp protease protease subunit
VRNLIQLLAANKGQGKGLKVEASGENEATIYVYDAIGSYYGVEAQSFVRDLANITASTIHLRINSPGGDVFEARAMKTALEQHKAKVVAHVDGLSASAASFLMLAADEIEISEGAFVMIHQPWTIALGTSAELRESAELLDKVGAAIANDYHARTGKKLSDINDWMAAETWFDADEAIANGFADRKAEKKAASNAYDLSAYRNAPQALANPAPETFEALAADRQRYEARLGLYERA